MEINSKEELVTLLGDLQGQMANMQETIDKLSPVEEKADEADESDDAGKEEGSEEEEISEDEVNEIDKLLQES